MQDASISQVNHTLTCYGDWTLTRLNKVLVALPFCEIPQEITLRGDAITAMDSAGAWVLWKLLQGKKFKLSGFKPEHESLLVLMDSESEKLSQVVPPLVPLKTLAQIGLAAVDKGYQVRDFIAFLGEITSTVWRNIRNPRLFQWRSFLNIIDETGYSALPIVGLLCFLIGVVLAYQGANQLRNYGADVYIVSILGIAILQEFGPLITAIIVAGRTSSAFTAQIGTMQINEEVDALRIMGLSPVNRLVLPKVLGLMVAMPLLVVWADIFGLLGGMITTKQKLNVGIYNFILQFPHVIKLSTFINGMIKTPVFAAIIASVGCFQGFRVTGTADSIGKQTTKSVVQAIFLIIIADSIFSIILPWQNI